MVLIGVCAAGVVSCDRSPADDGSTVGEQGTVVLYVSADDHVAKPVLRAFERTHGVRVLMRGDTEATKNTGLAQKLRAERRHPRADVFWSSELFLTIALADEGVLEPFVPKAPSKRPARFQDPNHVWHAFAQRSRVVVYNTERLSASDVPTTMHDLLDMQFRGRIVMARPRFGTTRGHMAALVAMWGEDRTTDWMQKLRDNNVRLLDGNASVVRAVARGEADVGLTDTDDVWGGQRNGWPVDLMYIRHDAPGADSSEYAVLAGPFLIPNAVSRVAGGPNPDNAAKLIEFLLSKRVERMLAESESRNIPTYPELARAFSDLAVRDPATVSYADVAHSMAPAMQLCEDYLDH